MTTYRVTSQAELDAAVVAVGQGDVIRVVSGDVLADGSATVHAYASATVHAGPYVAAYVHSDRAVVHGGIKMDVTPANLKDPERWVAYTGVQTEVDDGVTYATVYKAVNADLDSEHHVAYPIGQTVTAPDWRDDNTCGGGLHFGPTPSGARVYYRGPTPPRYLACRVRLDGLRPIISGPPKCKAASCQVLYEVGLDGHPIAADAAVTA